MIPEFSRTANTLDNEILLKEIENGEVSLNIQWKPYWFTRYTCWGELSYDDKIQIIQSFKKKEERTKKILTQLCTEKKEEKKKPPEMEIP
jgi:hypothetical protein